MLALRLIVLATAIALGFMVLAWMLSGDRRWLARAWLTFRVALFAVVLVLLLFLGEAVLRSWPPGGRAAVAAHRAPAKRACDHEAPVRNRA